MAQRDDKTAMNEDFLILTLFAVAMELEQNGFHHGSFDVYLSSTALPPAYLNNRELRGSLKQFFRRQADFQYNGRAH